MNYDTQGFLDRAEQALLNCHADRRLSEASFLWHILRELGEDRLASAISPATLFREAKIGWPRGDGSPFLIVGLPSQPPRIPCLAGDWMLRVAPGTGDVGHVSLLASGDLLPRSALDAEGILAEGNQPGYYGIVIESGAFPHRRDEPFARRILDSRGRLPAHTVVLRPSVFVGRQRERDTAEGTDDFSTWQPWEIAVFRALFGGERRLETLRKMARDRGAPAAAIQYFLQNYLKVPFPPVPQSGGVDCEKQRPAVAPASPEAPAGRFTGRYESRNAEGKRYFWAINQAGSAVIAVRTTRFCHANDINSGVARYWKLRGTIRPDGSAVMFADHEPEQLWGYLEPFGTLRSYRWRSWSFRDSHGNRVVVRESPKLDETTWTWDETLTPAADLRPTMMESLWSLADERVSVLLKQHEWWPLTNEQYDFLADGAQSDLLRDLLTTYFNAPEGITFAEKQAKRTAAAQVAAFVAHLLWDGTSGSRPEMPATQPRLVQFADEARRKVPVIA